MTKVLSTIALYAVIIGGCSAFRSHTSYSAGYRAGKLYCAGKISEGDKQRYAKGYESNAKQGLRDGLKTCGRYF